MSKIWNVLPPSSYIICSTARLLNISENRVHNSSNDMHNIFLLLTLAAQFEFLKSTHFFAHPLRYLIADANNSSVDTVRDRGAVPNLMQDLIMNSVRIFVH